jgi:hypothetical protein
MKKLLLKLVAITMYDRSLLLKYLEAGKKIILDFNLEIILELLRLNLLFKQLMNLLKCYLVLSNIAIRL